jgi:hypothetical protein
MDAAGWFEPVSSGSGNRCAGSSCCPLTTGETSSTPECRLLSIASEPITTRGLSTPRRATATRRPPNQSPSPPLDGAVHCRPSPLLEEDGNNTVDAATSLIEKETSPNELWL